MHQHTAIVSSSSKEVAAHCMIVDQDIDTQVLAGTT